MQLTVIGSGDAFSSGGRLHPCFHVSFGTTKLLIDCGATALIGLRRAGLDPNEIETIVLSHLHGDHFAGIIWLLLYGQHPGQRQSPLTIYGPVGTEQRIRQAYDVLYPGAADVPSRFPVSYVTFDVNSEIGLLGGRMRTYAAQHPSGAPSTMLRFEIADKVLAYSGDTEWSDDLLPCAEQADLFITECFSREKPIRYHLDWPTLARNVPHLTARRILLTHMSQSMLDNPPEPTDPRVSFADDGQVIVI
ncbi:MAG: MBL fold metallo-hydrolase [Pseudomonadota bacterium]